MQLSRYWHSGDMSEADEWSRDVALEQEVEQLHAGGQTGGRRQLSRYEEGHRSSQGAFPGTSAAVARASGLGAELHPQLQGDAP